MLHLGDRGIDIPAAYRTKRAHELVPGDVVYTQYTAQRGWHGRRLVAAVRSVNNTTRVRYEGAALEEMLWPTQLMPLAEGNGG